MASTYTTNTGIELITTGEQSGTWGDTTNVNLQIIDRLTNGVGSIALSGTTHTLTTTDGTLSDGHYAVLVFGGSPSGTNTVTVSPNDQQKVFIVKNGSGQTVVLSQGSGGNVTLLNGDSKIVYCDGAGASAAVVDVTGDLALSDVNIDGGSIDAVTLGTNSPVTEAQIDNLNLNGNAITSTNTNGNIAITPNGTGEVDISKVDIDGGTIDGTVIGGSTPAAGGFTNITVTGTVDGRDVAADGTKLDGIEAGADVTDTANVTAAGALMDSELTDIAAVKALDQGVATTDSPTFVELTAAQYNSTEALPDIKPSLNLDFANTKALDPRITYTRGSTATYYDGKTFAKAEENLLLYSQDWTQSSWGKSSTTVTGDNTTAPDGTTTADKVENNSAGTFRGVVQDITAATSTSYSGSIYVKRGNYDNIRFGLDERNSGSFVAGLGFVVIDTSDGSVLNSSGTHAVTDVGNGWYKIELSVATSASGINQVRASVYFADSNYSPSGLDIPSGSNVYLWGAQVEQRDALTDYTATTTQPITNYVPALQTAASGEPRFDHDPITGESKGFLIEEQRTNLVTYSEQFDNAAWTKTGCSVTSNIVVAPDGTLTGDKLVEDTSTGSHRFHQQVTTSAGEVTATYYVKAAERDYVQVRFQEGGSYVSRVEFNLATGQIELVQNGTSTITFVGNGWYRISLTATSAGSATFQTQLWMYDSTPTGGYTGDGYSGIYLWGAQLEQGSFPTSYIPTVASQVTRSLDAASMTGTNFSSWYRQDEGTVYTKASKDILPPAGINAATVYMLSDGNVASNSIFNQRNAAGSANQIQTFVFGSAQTALFKGTTSTADIAVANAYKEDNSAVSFDGETSITNSNNSVPRNVDQLTIGARVGTGSYQLNGHIKKLAYYPKRLSNATLQALTEE
jgi:hypothetical protein